MWALVKADQVIEVFGSAKAMTINGVQHPASIFNNWTKEELKTIIENNTYQGNMALLKFTTWSKRNV